MEAGRLIHLRHSVQVMYSDLAAGPPSPQSPPLLPPPPLPRPHLQVICAIKGLSEAKVDKMMEVGGPTHHKAHARERPNTPARTN